MDRSANARTEPGTIPRTRTAAAETHRAREKAVRGGRGTVTSPGAGSMYMQQVEESRPPATSPATTPTKMYPA